jgi:hypothetical protein
MSEFFYISISLRMIYRSLTQTSNRLQRSRLLQRHQPAQRALQPRHQPLHQRQGRAGLVPHPLRHRVRAVGAMVRRLWTKAHHAAFAWYCQHLADSGRR